MDPLCPETCWSNFKYIIIILIISTNYIFVHLLDNKVFCHFYVNIFLVKNTVFYKPTNLGCPVTDRTPLIKVAFLILS